MKSSSIYRSPITIENSVERLTWYIEKLIVWQYNMELIGLIGMSVDEKEKGD